MTGGPGRLASAVRATSLPETKASERDQARDRALFSSIWSGAAIRIATALLTMGYFAISVRALTKLDFGVLATIATFSGLMAFADLGIGSGLMTKLAQAHGRDDEAAAVRLISSACCAMLALGGVVTVCGVVSAVTMPWNRLLGVPGHGGEQVTLSVASFFVCTGLAIPANLGQRVLLARQKGFLTNLWLLGSGVTTLAVICLLAQVHVSLCAFTLALIGCPVGVSLAQTLWVFTSHLPNLRPHVRHATRSDAMSLARISGMFLALNVAVALAYQSDALIVASSLGALSAASFAVALRLFTALSGVLSGASQQLWTSMAEALAHGDLPWVRSRFVKVLRATAAVAVMGCLFLVALGGPLAQMWVGRDLRPPLTLLCAFAVWTVYSVVMSQTALLLNAGEVITPQLIMAFCMTCLNIVLSVYLTRRIGLTGPLYGSLAAHVLCSGVPSIVLARRLLRGSSSRTMP
jgi:O-antigen/teichoic acid export membrane protein